MVERLRIAHVTATFPPYQAGAGAVCYYNALYLSQRGHEVTVFTRAYDNTPNDMPFAVKRLKPVISIGNAPILPGLLTLREFDLVHLHLPFISGAELTWLATLVHRVPYIITYHNDLIADGLKGRFFDVYSWMSLPLVFGRAKILGAVTVDHAVHSRAARSFARHAQRLRALPNGVDVQHFHPDVNGQPVRAAFDIPTSAPVILFVGALDHAHHYRRVDLLLDVVATLPDTHAIIVGDGDKRADYEAHADQLNMRQRVHFMGKLTHAELPPVYTASDVLVLPSECQESFGMVLIEAMACGVPVIASRLPGSRSVVLEGQTGWLVTPSHPNDLRDKLCLALEDPVRRRAMGLRGRKHVEETFSWTAVVTRLEAIYEEALGYAN